MAGLRAQFTLHFFSYNMVYGFVGRQIVQVKQPVIFLLAI